MQSNILNSLGIDPGIIVIAMMGIMVFVLLYMVRVSMKLTRFMKKYRIFMRGKDAVSLEKAFSQKFLEVDKIVELNKTYKPYTRHSDISVNNPSIKLILFCVLIF